MQNYITKQPYTGKNLIALLMSGYENPNFLTYKQAQEVGRQVRKGELGIGLMRVVTIKRRDKKTGELKNAQVPKYFTVFNITQTDETKGE